MKRGYLWEFDEVHTESRAIVQAVSNWLPTAASRVRAQVTTCGICGGQSGAGAALSEFFGFPWQSSFHEIAPQSPSIIWDWCKRPISGRRTKCTNSHRTLSTYGEKSAAKTLCSPWISWEIWFDHCISTLSLLETRVVLYSHSEKCSVICSLIKMYHSLFRW
jgi:hypothetical protein